MSTRTWNQLAWMAITALIVLVFAQVIEFQFVNWDDLNHLSHPGMTEATWDHFFGFWQRSYYNFYIPVAYSVWFLVGAAEGLFLGRPGQMVFNPSHFHAVNLVFHLLNAGLVFAFLRRILIQQKRSDEIVRWGSFFGAAVFAVHPVQVETVAWVSGLRDLLACTFSLVTLHFMVPAEKGRERTLGSLIVATFALTMALLAKPSAIVVPFIFLLLDFAWLRKDRHGHANWRLVPLILMSLVFAGITAWLQSSADMDFVSPWWSRPLMALDSLGFYAMKLVAPWPLIPDYGRNPRTLIESGQIYWTWIPTLMAGALLFYQLRKSQIFYALLMVLVALLPTSGLVAFRFQDVSTVADHYLYFPMVFVVLAGALWMGTAKLARWAGVLFVLSCAAYSLMQAQHWKNSETLSTWELAENPRSFSFLNSRADFYARSGDCLTALGLYEKSMQISPHLLETRMNIGACLYKVGRADEAITVLEDLVANKAMPGFVVLNLVEMLVHKGAIPEAIVQMEKALDLNPELQEVRAKLQSLQGPR